MQSTQKANLRPLYVKAYRPTYQTVQLYRTELHRFSYQTTFWRQVTFSMTLTAVTSKHDAHRRHLVA